MNSYAGSYYANGERERFPWECFAVVAIVLLVRYAVYVFTGE